ncbi:helix-turn-helix domain-containing protein [Alkalihalobacillus pseudalcaliphilus]|uniref:helix-turn-helix domain-containing protein n=1 Tax=Alkalihalobacillus pseudalcaliphilus TaxID=79884 RepID=UPI00064DF1C3|nr:helix-turn-helix transcriptional regulator [Alkalihalobacillus pseudalcaliphilus]KMK77638.1 XRE family transcriptional regulator [Alkalihalobacillus pseudalcaliphilus]
MGTFGKGLGRKRTRLGIWLDDRGISQQWLSEKSGVGRNTISKLCKDDNYNTSLETIKKLMGALRFIDPNAKTEDFFDL